MPGHWSDITSAPAKFEGRVRRARRRKAAFGSVLLQVQFDRTSVEEAAIGVDTPVVQLPDQISDRSMRSVGALSVHMDGDVAGFGDVASEVHRRPGNGGRPLTGNSVLGD